LRRRAYKKEVRNMTKKHWAILYWLPTIFYGIYMLIVSIVYGFKWDLTITIGILLFSLLLLIPLLLFSIINTLIKTQKTKIKIIINAVCAVFIVAGIVAHICLFFNLSDWLVCTIPPAFLLLVFAVTFLIKKESIKKENSK
jgi:uncharacterized membrane protein